jgi:hypothetical protein
MAKHDVEAMKDGTCLHDEVPHMRRKCCIGWKPHIVQDAPAPAATGEGMEPVVCVYCSKTFSSHSGAFAACPIPNTRWTPIKSTGKAEGVALPPRPRKLEENEGSGDHIFYSRAHWIEYARALGSQRAAALARIEELEKGGTK